MPSSGARDMGSAGGIATPKTSAVRCVLFQSQADPASISFLMKKEKVHHMAEKPANQRLWAGRLQPFAQKVRGHSSSGWAIEVIPVCGKCNVIPCFLFQFLHGILIEARVPRVCNVSVSSTHHIERKELSFGSCVSRAFTEAHTTLVR